MPERVFLLLQDEQFLYATFDYFVDKLLYLKNKKEKKDVTLKLYDKEAEISKSGKKYIQDWNSMKKIWRTEVSVRWPKFKEWLSIINSSENYPDSWKRYINPNAGQPHQSQSEPQEEFIERVFLLLQDEQKEFFCYCKMNNSYMQHLITLLTNYYI